MDSSSAERANHKAVCGFSTVWRVDVPNTCIVQRLALVGISINGTYFFLNAKEEKNQSGDLYLITLKKNEKEIWNLITFIFVASSHLCP